MPYFSLSALARRVGHLHFVVIDGTGALRGMARLDELELPDDEALRNLILIEDMLVEEVEPVYTYQMTCIRRFRSCWTAV